MTNIDHLVMVIHCHPPPYRAFKASYLEHVRKHLRAEFPGLVSYNRFVGLMPTTLLPMCLHLVSRFARHTPG